MGSALKYSAMPPRTPRTTRFDEERDSFFFEDDECLMLLFDLALIFLAIENTINIIAAYFIKHGKAFAASSACAAMGAGFSKAHAAMGSIIYILGYYVICKAFT